MYTDIPFRCPNLCDRGIITTSLSSSSLSHRITEVLLHSAIFLDACCTDLAVTGGNGGEGDNFNGDIVHLFITECLIGDG